jgi:two-component system sensor histidine kinase UhpB
MSSQVLEAHEGERKRIARELHDDTAQALTSILVRLRLLERSARDEDVLKNVEELRDLTSGALDSVRRMAMDLRPAALDDLGLVPALHAYAEKYSRTWPVSMNVSVTNLSRRLPADVELVLYRVVQEALSNVAKHASASNASVSLRGSRNEVTLRIEDDGVGFDAADVTPVDGSGLGLFGMRERLALVGGELEIQSSKGQGTTIVARVPLAGKAGGIRRAL